MLNNFRVILNRQLLFFKDSTRVILFEINLAISVIYRFPSISSGIVFVIYICFYNYQSIDFPVHLRVLYLLRWGICLLMIYIYIYIEIYLQSKMVHKLLIIFYEFVWQHLHGKIIDICLTFLKCIWIFFLLLIFLWRSLLFYLIHMHAEKQRHVKILNNKKNLSQKKKSKKDIFHSVYVCPQLALFKIYFWQIMIISVAHFLSSLVQCQYSA